MKIEPYIQSGSEGIDLYFIVSLLDFDELPIIFIAGDDEGKIYLCDCTEFRFGKQRWTIGETTIAVLKDLIEQRISVYKALGAISNNVTLAEYDYSDETYQQDVVSFEEVPDYRLPAKDSMLRFVDEGVNIIPILKKW